MGKQNVKDKDTKEPVHYPGTRKGEEIVKEEGKEPGRYDREKTGKDRPSGGSTSRDSTGINPEAEKPIHPDSPEMPPA